MRFFMFVWKFLLSHVYYIIENVSFDNVHYPYHTRIQRTVLDYLIVDHIYKVSKYYKEETYFTNQIWILKFVHFSYLKNFRILLFICLKTSCSSHYLNYVTSFKIIWSYLELIIRTAVSSHSQIIYYYFIYCSWIASLKTLAYKLKRNANRT